MIINSVALLPSTTISNSVAPGTSFHVRARENSSQQAKAADCMNHKEFWVPGDDVNLPFPAHGVRRTPYGASPRSKLYYVIGFGFSFHVPRQERRILIPLDILFACWLLIPLRVVGNDCCMDANREMKY